MTGKAGAKAKPPVKSAKKPVEKRAKAGTSREAAAQRRSLFVEALLSNNENALEAALAVGFSPKTAGSQGSRLLKDVKVQQELRRRRELLLDKFKLTSERTLREIARLAYSDPRAFYNADGSLKQIHELDDDTAATVASIEMDEVKAGGVVIGITRKVKQWDKNAALEKAMKHLGEYEKDNRQRNPIQDLPDDALRRLIDRKAKEAGVTLH